MQIRLAQLSATLEKTGLLPVYYVSGDETLQLLESVDLLRETARAQGYEERVVLDVDNGFDWERLQQTGANLSLFSSKRIIELRLGEQKPGRAGNAALADYLATASPDNLLLLTSARMDRNVMQTKWFKALDRCGAWIRVWPVESTRLPGWIAARCRARNKQISGEAAQLIAQRVEGNLLAAKQEIDKLAVSVEKSDIDSSDVLNIVVDSARFDIFELIDDVFLGKPARVVRILRGLQKEGIEPLNVYGALMWAFRRANSIAVEIARGKAGEQVFNAYRLRDQTRSGVSALLGRYRPEQLAGLLAEAVTIDKALKGALTADGWQMLERFMLQLAGCRFAYRKPG